MPSEQEHWPRLMLIGDRHLADASRLAQAAAAAAVVGPVIVQVREKDLADAESLRLVRQVREALDRVAPAGQVRIAVNGRFDLALAAGADGVHLTSSRPSLARVRDAVGGRLFVGASTHSPEEAGNAASEGADYVVFGPVYATPSKQGLGEPQGLARLAEAARATHPVPLLAIGGIDRDRVAACRAAGAHGVAVIRSVLAAADPPAAAREIHRSLLDASSGGRA